MTGMNGTDGAAVGEAIDFGLSALWMETRAQASDFDDLVSIGVYGYHTETERWGWASQNIPGQLTANYFTNTELKKTDSWSYSPLKYWPADTRKKISFFAYSPYTANVDANGDPITPAGPIRPYPALDTETGIPVIEYTVPAGITQQIDLLRTARLDLDQTLAPVSFPMEHALASINFSIMFAAGEAVKGYDVEVRGITIGGIHGTGTLDLGTGRWSFPATAPADEFSVTADLGDPKPRLPTHSLLAIPCLPDEAGTMMLIPQDLSSAFVSFDLAFYKSGVQDAELTAAFPLSDTKYKVWEAGRQYNYELSVSGDFITIETSAWPWMRTGNDTGGNVNL